ncbi:porin family protein [Brevundimonas diminuta]|uniref:porin family protein n=1 Tax=Brevundimonas diminuta TaxID=293 RepID=UPI00320B464C
MTIYEALAKDADPDVRAEARYRHGLLLADEQQYAQAAVLFRALLDEKPEVLVARLELARMLAAMGKENEARRELRQAQAVGIPEEAAAMVDRFTRALRSDRRFGGAVELAFVPDSNINRATEARTLDTVIAPLTLSDDARARSGTGIRTMAQVYGRFPLSGDWSVVPRGGAQGVTYRQGQFNDVSASALVGLERRGQRNSFTVSVGHGWRWFGNELYAETSNVGLDWIRPLGTRSQFVTSVSASDVRYSVNDLQNGGLYDLSVSLEKALNARSGISLAGSVTRQTAQDSGYATWAGGLSSGYWRETRWGTAFVSGSMRRTKGDERLFLFPDKRREWLGAARVGMTLRSLEMYGFAPTVRLGFERNSSTVGIYEYRRVSVDVGVARAF